MDFGQRGRRGGRGRGFGGGFRRDGGFDDNRNRSDSSNWRSQNSDGVSSSENDTTKMYVEENCVGRIIGRGGSKIRELQDSSGANIKVNRNETEGGKVLVVVKGSADARTQAEDMIKELTESFNGLSAGNNRGGGGRSGWGRSSEDTWGSSAGQTGNGEETLGSSSETTDIYVDPSCVGRIIGKGGSKIRELQDESGANIKVNRNETEGGKVLVVVTGSADARTQAEDMIKELTESFNDSSGYRGGGGGGRSSDWDFNDGNADSVGNGEETFGSSSETTDIYVDPSCVGRIIGKGGSKIRELQDESGANIKVNRNETEGGKVLVVVTGSADARRQAEDMIKELTESFNDSSGYRGGGGGGGRSSDWDFNDGNADSVGNGEETFGSSSETTDIYVDPSCVGRIIGKGGSKIRELQDESGANIKVNRNETEGGKVLVVVTGSADARTQAEDMIKELTESFNDSSGYRGGGGGGRSSDWDFNDGNADSVGNGEKTRMFNNKGSSSETTEIHVDQSCVGRIIGRGGSKIQDLQDESGAKIKVTRNETEEGKIIVVLTGSADARTQAEDMIKELTESCFDSSSSYRGGGGGRSTGWGSTDDNAGNGEETEKPKINWGIIRAAKEANEAKKFEGLPPLEKNFYFEDPDVANMHPGEVKEIRKKNNNIIVEGGEKRVPNPVRTFEEAFQHYPEILQQIYNQKFVEPSPIQKQAWPILLQGLDLIGIAQTGTGKTLAFLLPALIHIDNQPVPREQRGGPNVLVLSPTRELAQQIEVEVKKINYRGIRSVVVYGGGNRRSQINVVTRGVEIIVATPGRLNDLIMNGIVDVKSVTYLVLDEADRMLDMGFEPEIRKILLDIRRDRQTVMTSATWPQDVQRLADMYMSSPINIFVGTLDLAACHSVTQLVEMLDDEEKKPRLFEFLQYELQPIDKVIVFVGKKVLADDLSSDLAMEGVECQCIHGDREQCDREAALSDFKSGAVRILIATDVASRGLDVKDITHVLNYDFPRNIEEYVHRIGRTGRAGNTGTSITFITRGDWRQAQKLIDIMAEADQEIPDILIKMAERYQAHRERVAQEGGGFGGRGGRGGRGRGGGFGGGRRGGGGFGGGGGGGEDDGFFSGGFGRGAFRGGGGRGRRDKEYDIHMGW